MNRLQYNHPQILNIKPLPAPLPYKGGKRSSFYDWRGFELGSLYDKKVQLLAVLSIATPCPDIFHNYYQPVDYF